MTSVTIGIPVFNGAAFLAETIQSALSQDMDDLEIIIADDGSTDDSLDIVARFTDPRLRVLSGPTNGGAAENWNRLLGQASGEWVKILCQDDLVYPWCLARQLDVASRRDDVAMVAARRDIILPDGRVLVRNRGLGGLQGLVEGHRAIKETVRSGTNLFGEPSIVLLRRAAAIEAGGFSPSHHYTIDLECWCRVLRTGSLAVCDERLGAFRVSPHQWSARLGGEQQRECADLFAALADDPELPVNRWDARLGSVRAAGQAIGRRAVYRWMRTTGRLKPFAA